MTKEIEATVIVGLLSDRYLLNRVMSDGFSPDTFTQPNLRAIFRTAHDMSQIPGQVVDWITIESGLKVKNWFTPELGQIIEKLKNDPLPEADQLMAYVDILREQGLRDRMLKLSQVMSNYAHGKGQYQRPGLHRFQCENNSDAY